MKEISVKKNFIYQVSYQLVVILLPLITSPYISRALGAEMIGEYSYSFSVANYFVLFAALGIQNYGNREIAISKNDNDLLNETFSSIYWLHFFSSLMCILIYTFYVFFLGSDGKYALIMGLYVCSSIFDINWFYFGMEQFKTTSIRNIIIKIISAIAIFVFVKKENDLWLYCLIMSSSYFISEIVLWFPLRKYIRLSRVNYKKSLTHLKPMLVLFIPTIAISLYKLMDKIMIGALTSKVELGYYENSEKICSIPLVIIASVGTVMLPRMTNLISNNGKKQFNKYIETSINYVMCAAFAMAFGLAAVAKSFAPLYWGEAFAPCAILMIGISVTIPFVSFANVIRTQYLIPNKKDKEYVISVVVGAIVNLIVNILLIPQYQAKGAVVGTIAAEVSVCLIQVYSVKKELPIIRFIKEIVPYFVFACVMYVLVDLFSLSHSRTIINLVLQVILGCIIYFLLVVSYLLLNKKRKR